MERQTNNITDKFVNITWQPNPKIKKALHKQIVDYISAKVASGDWTVGSKLPPQRELAKLFGISCDFDDFFGFDLRCWKNVVSLTQ